MTLRAIDPDPEALRLDPTAVRALISAVQFQLAAWKDTNPGDIGEDEFADMQNDILYMEILLQRLQAEHGRMSPPGQS